MPYTPDPLDTSQPDDTVIAETAAAEFRALKEFLALGSFQWLQFALGDQTSAVIALNPAFTTRFPKCHIVDVRTSVQTASSANLPTVDVKMNGVSIFSTLPTIDVGEKTSVTAATPAVIANPEVVDDAEIIFSITVPGTDTKGPMISLLVYFEAP